MFKLIKKIFSTLNYTKRRTWGFDESELWNFDITIAKFILPRLIKFKENNPGGYPAILTLDEWNDILNKMIFAFEKITQEKQLEYPKEIQEGTELFGKWIQALWW